MGAAAKFVYDNKINNKLKNNEKNLNCENCILILGVMSSIIFLYLYFNGDNYGYKEF